MNRTILWGLAGLVLIAVASLVGTETLSPLQFANPDVWMIWSEFRAPRIIFVFFTGAALALVGSVYQAILVNPLADPYVLGTSSASALAVVIAGLFGAANNGWPAGISALFSTALLTSTLVYLSQRHRGRSPEVLLLFGFAANLVLSSILFIILSMNANVLGAGSMRWLFGRIPWVGWASVLWYGGLVASFSIPILFLARAIAALSLGDGVCRSLGHSPLKTRAISLALCAVLVAIAVSHTGSIGFIGMVVPHLYRRLARSGTGPLGLMGQHLWGGVFLVVADALSRSIRPPLEIPIGIVTTLLGGPIFLGILWRRTKEEI